MAVGSDTASLAGNVLKWRQADPKVANDLWTSLDEENKKFGTILKALSTEWEKNFALYEQVANYLSSLQQIQVRSISLTPWCADLSHGQTHRSGKPIRTCQRINDHLSIVS